MTGKSKKREPALSDYVRGMFLAGYTFEEMAGSPWLKGVSLTDSVNATRLWLDLHAWYSRNCVDCVHDWESE